ncbi:MAG: hypothetical protein JXB50_10555 [Spirochaetes bacterium]|nr:hypothetical protein [Spirochaetota bacterium]
MNEACCSNYSGLIRKLNFNFLDWFKSIYCLLFAFKKKFIIDPGLYYIGEKYDINLNLLVTCNYHLTVHLLWNIVRNRNLRLLVIDTKGINVWCSSGKGQFSSNEILKQLNRYEPEQLTIGKKLEIILPKLSMSGVSLSELRKNFIIPKIGPIYMRDIPDYLDKKPLEDRTEDKFEFNFKDRLFTLIPSLLQFTKYSLFMAAALFIWNYFFKTNIHYQVILISIIIAVLYIIFFPILPTKNFSIKGLFLALFLILTAVILLILFKINLPILSSVFYIFFISGISLFFALYYTGSSGVSNYSLVKKEVIRYLPLSFLLILSSFITIIITGVTK